MERNSVNSLIPMDMSAGVTNDRMSINQLNSIVLFNRI